MPGPPPFVFEVLGWLMFIFGAIDSIFEMVPNPVQRQAVSPTFATGT
jgi:hypothetical protein